QSHRWYNTTCQSFSGPTPIASRNNANTGNDLRFNSHSIEQPLSSNQNIENDSFAISNSKQYEQLVLMTAEGNKVLFFFDTGARKTVIKEAFAERLSLPKLTTETSTGVDAEFLQARELFIANSQIRGKRQVPQILVVLTTTTIEYFRTPSTIKPHQAYISQKFGPIYTVVEPLTRPIL
ncbi:hypothetical protein COOONC_00505, partial [Cooperia oncophora]